MKSRKTVLIFAIWCLTSMIVDAQIILGPQTTGSVSRVVFFGGSTSMVPYPQNISVGEAFSPTNLIFAEARGIIEFQGDATPAGGLFPTAGMTTSNWTAQLNNITITWAQFDSGDTMDLFLHSLNDSQEDGAILPSDFNGYDPTSLALLFTHIPPPGTAYNNVDITEALRHDLFGPGGPDETLGFIFRSVVHKRAIFMTMVRMDHQLPNIVVNVFTPVPCLHHGDVTLNNEITAADAQRAFEIVMSIYMPDTEESCAADCNGDDDITAGDAQQIFGVVFGGTCADPLP